MNDSLITKKNKKNIKPYRKYQLIILILLIFIISCYFYIHNKLSSSLSNYFFYIESVDINLQHLEFRYKTYEKMLKSININYYNLYKLDKYLQSDILYSLSDFERLTKFANNKIASFSICYKATVHGDDFNAIKENCGGQSPYIILVQTVNGQRFGGYSSQAFGKTDSYKEWIYDESAFIFSFDLRRRYKILKPEKAVGDFKYNSIYFGELDFVLGKNFLTNASSYSLFPSGVYEDDINTPRHFALTGGQKFFQIKEVEVLNIFLNEI